MCEKRVVFVFTECPCHLFVPSEMQSSDYLLRTNTTLFINHQWGGYTGEHRVLLLRFILHILEQLYPIEPNSLPGIILHLVMPDKVLCCPSGVVSEWRRAAGGADKPDRGRSGPVCAADWLAARHPLHRDGSCRHWPRRGRSEPPHQPSE